MNKASLRALSIFAVTICALLFQNCGKTTDLSEYTDQASASIPVEPGPKITASNTPGSVGFFQPAVLSVAATGNNLVYQWQESFVRNWQEIIFSKRSCHRIRDYGHSHYIFTR